MIKKTVLLDFDGVLNDYNGNYSDGEIEPLRDGALDFLERLSKEFKIILFTSRDLYLVNEWVIENNLWKYFEKITNIKEPAFLIVDDRCVRFNGDYNQTLNDISNFKVWYKD